jgi:uncharacterized protein (DUF342 family)
MGDLYMGQNTNENETAAPANPQAELFGKPNDGNLAIVFTEKDLEVRADFIPPAGGGQPVGTAGVGAILDKINVSYGIRWDDINEALNECNTNHTPVKDVVIARGDPPEDEIAEYFDINPELTRGPLLAEERGRVDFRSRSPYIIVKKDQALAMLQPHQTGKEGKNVHNEPLPFSVLKPEGVIGGANTRTENNFILAQINGQLVQNQKTLSVQDTLVIKGGVGYATGNIVFPGDVMINGPVSDGFKIFSGGSVVIKQTFDVTEVVTKGDLVVGGGVIGRGAGLLKSGGAIRTKFIENCRAAARKSVIVQKDIINSSVFTLEKIEMSDKGMILGSDIYAVQGVRTSGIGRKSGKSSRIHCGIDFTVQQEKEKCNNRLRMLAAKLAKLRELMDEAGVAAEKMVKMEELLRRLEEDQRRVSAQLSDLLGHINTDENAVVEVTGEIIPGTLIEICQAALYVTEPMRKVRIRLERGGGKLITESL